MEIEGSLSEASSLSFDGGDGVGDLTKIPSSVGDVEMKDTPIEIISGEKTFADPP
jgi:hypothetical protein